MNTRSVKRGALAFVAIAASLLAPPLGAEDIDVDAAVAMALESNLGIESEVLSVAQKRLIANTWWNRFYPTTNLSYTFGRLNEEPESPGLGVPAQPRTFMSASLDMSLVLTFQLAPGISLARLDYEAGLITLDEARARVVRDVSKQFFDLVLLREQIALTEERIATAQRRFEQAQVNFDNGLIDEFTLLSSQVQLENLRPGLTGLEVAYQQQLLALKNSLGLPLTAEISPVGTIDPPVVTVTRGEIDAGTLERRFDVQQLRQLELILRQQRRAADFAPQGGRAPYIRFGLTVDPTFQGDPLEDSWFDGDLWQQNSGAFTVSIVQPLDGWIPFSQTRNSLADFDRQLARNRLNTEQTLRGAEIAISGLLLGIRTSQETIDALEENVRLARRAFELAEIGYQNGLRDLIEVQSAEVDLRDAEFQLLQERKNVMDSVLDLQFELNRSIEEITQTDE